MENHWKTIINIVPRLSRRIIYSIRSLVKFGALYKGIIIKGSLEITNFRRIEIGKNVYLSRNIILNVFNNGKLQLEDGVYVGNCCHINCANSISIRKNTLLADNVYIADVDHEYRDVSMPIKYQGYTVGGDIIIDSGSWIGANSIILPGVRIGKNSVIGANSIVSSDIPDYCVAVGIPAKVIKRFDNIKKEWIIEK